MTAEGGLRLANPPYSSCDSRNLSRACEGFIAFTGLPGASADCQGHGSAPCPWTTGCRRSEPRIFQLYFGVSLSGFLSGGGTVTVGDTVVVGATLGAALVVGAVLGATLVVGAAGTVTCALAAPVTTAPLTEASAMPEPNRDSLPYSGRSLLTAWGCLSPVTAPALANFTA